MLMYTNTLPRFPNFKSLFLKINLSPICYDIINEITRMQCQISKFFPPKLNRKNSHSGKRKKWLWTSDKTGLFRCVESHTILQYSYINFFVNSTASNFTPNIPYIPSISTLKFLYLQGESYGSNIPYWYSCFKYILLYCKEIASFHDNFAQTFLDPEVGTPPVGMLIKGWPHYICCNQAE